MSYKSQIDPSGKSKTVFFLETLSARVLHYPLAGVSCLQGTFHREKFFCASLNIHLNQSICANENRRSLSLNFAGFCAEMCDDVRSGDRSDLEQAALN